MFSFTMLISSFEKAALSKSYKIQQAVLLFRVVLVDQLVNPSLTAEIC